MVQTPNVSLTLLNKPENVAVIGRTLAGLAAALSLSPLEADAVRTAGEELCKNVVYHAYDGAEGPLELELYVAHGSMRVLVRDRGYGVRPRLGERTQPHTGIGLPMVHSLARSVAYTNLEGGGTEVLVELPAPSAAALAPLEAAPAQPPPGELEQGAGETIELRVGPPALVGPVLAGVLGALAGRAGLDAQAGAGGLWDELAAGVREALIGSQLAASFQLAAGELRVRMRPLGGEAAEGALLGVGERLGRLLERGGAERSVLSPAGGETLVLALRAGRPERERG